MDKILELLINYSYLVLFLGAVVEGEIFPLLAGFLVSMSLMNLPLALVVTFLGSVIGDWLWFLAGRRFGRKLIDRWGRFLWLKPSKLAWLENHFAKNGKTTLFMTKFIYSFGHSSIIVAGIAKMPTADFIKVDLIASLLWSVLFVGLGKLLGHSFGLLRIVVQDLPYIAVVLILLLIGVQILISKKITKLN